MNTMQARNRARELAAEVEYRTKQYDAGQISKRAYNNFVERAYDESKEIDKALNLGARANRMVAAQERAFDGSPVTKDMGRCRPPSPMDATPTQIKALYRAAQAKTPFSVEIGKPGLETEFAGQIHSKAADAVYESTLGGGFGGNLPPVQTQFAVGIGYEPTRIAALLPGASMIGPSATWFSHTADTNEAAGVPEGATKPNLGPTIIENQVSPQKIAGLVNLSLEAWQDTDRYGEASFSAWLPSELTRSLINTESLFLLQATTAATNPITGGPTGAMFDGLLNTSGTLTRDVGTDSPLDALNKSYVDLRTGTAFADPDLVVMHPETMGALRREKDSEGRYILDLLAGPLNLTSNGQSEIRPADEPNDFAIVPQGSPALAGLLWGAPIALTTQCPAGTAVVMSVAAGGGMFWQRLGLRLEFNMWSGELWTDNVYGFRAEERVALSVPRPAAVNIVTGLPAS